MNVLDLFSGIGGFSLGLERAGMRTVAFCEIEPFCQRVLAKHWPGVELFGDVRELDAIRADVDAICAGFPCQDASLGQTQWGARTGIDGERTGLWREVKRLAAHLRPQVVILENVPGLLSAGFGRVLGDLASIGYDAEWRCLPASKAGLPHRRDRLWVVAYPRSSRLSGYLKGPSVLESAEASLAELGYQAAGTWRSLDNALDGLRGVDGIPVQAHRDRVKAVGNSIVPQISEAIGRAIMNALSSQEQGDRIAYIAPSPGLTNMIFNIDNIEHALAVWGALRLMRLLRELWRTRKDKGYDASKWGAF